MLINIYSLQVFYFSILELTKVLKKFSVALISILAKYYGESRSLEHKEFEQYLEFNFLPT